MKRIKRLTLKNLQVAEIESKEMKKIRGGACSCNCLCATNNAHDNLHINYFIVGGAESY